MFVHLDLFPNPNEIVKATREKLIHSQSFSRALAGLPTLDAAYSKVGTEMTKIANSDLTGPFIDAWRQSRRFVKAAEASQRPPYPTVPVSIRKFEITYTMPHTIEVWLDRTRRVVVDAGLKVDITLTELIAKVRQGRLVEVSAGKSGSTATLTLEKVAILSNTVGFDLSVSVSLDPEGLPLQPA
jgi:hypothetical protein